MSTPGGWLRVFGRAIAVHGAKAARPEDRAALDAALEDGDFALARQLIDRLELRRASEPEPAAGTQL